jgi:hypothetical protein
VQDRISPMNYGFGATPEAATDALDFAQARTHIIAAEKTRGVHQRHHEGMK